MKTRFYSYIYALILSSPVIGIPVLSFAQNPATNGYGNSNYNQNGYQNAGAGYGTAAETPTGYTQPTGYAQPTQSSQPVQPGSPAPAASPAYNPAPVQPGLPAPPANYPGSYPANSNLAPNPAPASQPYPNNEPNQPGAQPPVVGPQRLNAPFQLSPQQQLQVDQVLTFWEKYTKGVKKFDPEFDLYTYPAVSIGGADVNSAPQSQKTTGFLKYESPNKGIYRVDGPPKELHRCNGKSLFSYNFDKMEINEYPFSDEESQELNKGPMAFLFGASASTLRDRYWIRLITPKEAPTGQIWLEAYPKTLEDRQDLVKAELIIQVKPVQPVAFQKYAPNGDRQVYHLKNVKINRFELFGREPFEPNERGFTLVKENN